MGKNRKKGIRGNNPNTDVGIPGGVVNLHGKPTCVGIPGGVVNLHV